MVVAPIFAAAAFAGALAFANGGVVRGMGKGDTVPAMLTPGEGVIPGGVSNLQGLCRSCHYDKTLEDKTYTGDWPDVVAIERLAPKKVWSF
jgi:hypothetical protein